MNIKNGLKNFYHKNPAIVATVLYFAIAIAFTFPLIAKFGSEIPQGRGDTFQAMSHIDSRVVSMRALDFPDKLIFMGENIGVHLPYVVLNMFLNKYAAYNTFFVLSFVLSGLGAYLLAYYFIKNRHAAFLAGLIFAFSPLHFYQATVVNLGTMHQEWIPFLILFLFKFFEKLQFKYFIAMIFFAFLIAMNEHQMLAFSAIFVVVVTVYKIITDESILRNKMFWVYVACSFGLLAVVAFGMFGEMLKVAISDNNFLDAGFNAANKYSIKFLDPLMPPVFHSFWPELSESLQEIVFGDSNRGSYFVGFSVLALLVYFIHNLLKRNVVEIAETAYRQNLIFWSAATAIFYVFSLGNSFSIGRFTIYLPYYLIYKFLPFYENIRTTGRMFVFAMLGVSILFAYGFSFLLKKYPLKKILLSVIFAAVILLEFWVAPIGMMSVSYSSFYDDIAKDSERYNLIEIPGSTSYDFASYNLFLNTIAKKPVLNGMPLARKISGQFDMQQETPIIKQLLYTIPKGNDPETKNNNDILKGFEWTQANDILNYYNVGYVTISKTYAKQNVQKLAESFIEKYVTYSDRFEDEFLVAFQVKKASPAGFYAQLMTDKQFSDTFKGQNGAINREVGSGAQIKLVNMETLPKKVSVTISAQAPVKINFNLTGNGLLQSPKMATENIGKYVFEMTLNPGENIVIFDVTDANGKAVLIREKKKDPKRALLVTEIVVNAQ